MRHLIRCAALCLLAFGPHAVGPRAEAASKWTQLQSENFLFIGDASEGQIRRVAERLEQFQDALFSVLPGPRTASQTPTIVIVFDTERSMTPLKPLFRGKPVDVAGYFNGGQDANYIVVNGESLDTSMLAIFHEYAHYLIHDSEWTVPLWVDEGLAELYAMTGTMSDRKSLIIGRAPAHHVSLLRTSTMMPVKELVAVDRTASIYNEGSRRGLLYAQSWALVHYLMLGNPTRAVEFRSYLSAMESGKSHDEAFSAAFNNAALLDSELHEYSRRFSFPAVQFDLPEKSAARAIPRGTTLADDEADAYLADLQARIDRVAEARVRVAAIQKRDATVGRAFMVLGAIDLREERVSEAVAHLGKAAALAPDDLVVQSTFARSLVAQLVAARNDTTRAAEIVSQARPVLARATTLKPNSAWAASMLGYVELVGGDALAAAAALTRAVVLDPRREEYRILLAQALVRQGEFDKATALLGPLMASGRTPDVRADARRVLGSLADTRVARERVPDTPPVTARAATAPTAAPTPVQGTTSTTSPTDALRDGDRASGLQLRVVQAGEQRLLGTLDGIDCVGGLVVFRVTTNGGPRALMARQFADVDFISYRSTAPGRVNCGIPKTRDRVYATYRPDAEAAGFDGRAVAIELLPEDFVPPKPRR